MQSNYPAGITGRESQITGEGGYIEARDALLAYDGRTLNIAHELSVSLSGPGLRIDTVLIELGPGVATFDWNYEGAQEALEFLAALDSADPAEIPGLFWKHAQ